MNDRELIKGCLENKREYQKTLYERFYGRMFAICLRYADGEEEAHQMLQEGFLETFKKLKSLRDQEPLESWIKKTFINSCIKHIRNDKEKRLIVSTVYANKNSGTNKNESKEITDDDIASKAKTNSILNAVQKLSSGYRIVFNLFLMDEYSNEEIAHILDISEETAKSNFEKSRFAFRKNLAEQLNASNGK